MNYPTDLELLEFFGIEPITQDDVTVYTVTDESGVGLTVSFNPYERSFQVSIRIGERVIAVVCQEEMSRLWISDGVLKCEFVLEDVRINVAVRTHPNIYVEWSGLRTI